MAITVYQQPQFLMPAYNPIILAATSTNQNQEGFQFVFDIFSASTSGRIARIKLPQNPEGYGVLDAHRILENYVKFDLNPTATGVTNATSSRFKYDIQIGEEYKFYWPFYDNYFASGNVGFTSHTRHYFEVGDRVQITQNPTGATNEQYDGVHTITSVPDIYSFVIDVAFGAATPAEAGTAIYSDTRKTIFSGLTAISGLTVNNAAFSHLDYLNYNFSDYNIQTPANTKPFFTDVPPLYEVRENSIFLLNGYSTGYTNINGILVFTSSDGENTEGIFLYTGATLTDDYFKVGAGPWNLNNTNFIAVSAFTINSVLPVIKTSTTSYSVALINNYSLAITSAYTFSVNHDCSRFEEIELIFLDRKGSFLSRTFELASRESVDISRQEYKNKIGGFNGSTFTYNSYDRGRTVYNVDIKRKKKATSNWMTESDAAYVEQLFTSPEVYWNNNGTFIPVVITSSSFDVKKQVTQKLINYEIEFEYAYSDDIQRG